MRSLLSVVITLLGVALVTSYRSTGRGQPRGGDFTCQGLADGTYPDTDDCTKFYKCSNGYVYSLSCPPMLHFDIKTYRCERPEDATCVECPVNSYWSSCGNEYPTCGRPTCAEPGAGCHCVPGCTCNRGHVWRGEECISIAACQHVPFEFRQEGAPGKRRAPLPAKKMHSSSAANVCPVNQHWSKCVCTPTCDDPSPFALPCHVFIIHDVPQCIAGCACDPGHVWYDKRCIPQHLCRYMPPIDGQDGTPVEEKRHATLPDMKMSFSAGKGFSCEGKPDGNYPDRGDCSKFYSCSNGIPTSLSCPQGLDYNEETDRCDYPENVDCAVRGKA